MKCILLIPFILLLGCNKKEDAPTPQRKHTVRYELKSNTTRMVISYKGEDGDFVNDYVPGNSFNLSVGRDTITQFGAGGFISAYTIDKKLTDTITAKIFVDGKLANSGTGHWLVSIADMP